MDLNKDYRFDVEKRLGVVIWLIAFFFIIVFVRLFYLQVVKGDYYKFFSENNSIRRLEIPASRGVIFDRNQKVLVDNKAAFNLVATPQYLTNTKKTALKISEIMNVNFEEIESGLNRLKKLPPYRAYTLIHNIDYDDLVKIKASKSPYDKESSLNGIDISYQYIRHYLSKDSSSHILGYLREIDQEKLNIYRKLYPNHYDRGDYIGVNGIEEKFETYLKGLNGFREIVVDALGREVEYPDIAFDLNDRNFIKGSDVYLSIDVELQNMAKELFAERRGALVALDPQKGDILALYSSPSFDLEKLSSSERNKYWGDIINNKGNPLFNRAIRALYPPASTYKIVVALAALKEDVVDLSEEINCKGGMKFGNRFFGCWRSGGHGNVNLIDAIAASCDVFFYKVGLRLGVDKIAKYSKLIGFASKSGFDILGEKEGLIPTEAWKLKNRGSKWNSGETLSIAIGQGYNLVTPLQVALMGAFVANNGYKLRPHIVDKIISHDGREIYKAAQKKVKIDEISDLSIDIVKQGMIDVVESEIGTAKSLRRFNIKIAGKTGTAQTISRESEKGGRKHENHAWFVGFAPYDDPKIVVAIIVERGGHGSSAAAPIAGKIMKYYLMALELQKIKSNLWLNKI